MTRSILSVLIAALCVLVTAKVQADTRVTVHDFYGPYAERVRDDVVNLLERQPGITIVSQAQVESTAERLGVDPSSSEGRVALGRELQLSAWMTGLIKRRSGTLKLTLVVFDGAQHTLVGRTRVSGSNPYKLSAEIKDHLWRKSRYAILFAGPKTVGAVVASGPDTRPEKPLDTTEPPATGGDATPAASSDETMTASSEGSSEASSESETVQATDSESPRDASDKLASASNLDSVDDDYADAPEPKAGRGEALRAFLGLGSPYRNLAYSGAITPSLGDYQLSGAPMFDLNVAFHPARPFTDGWASWLGLDVRAQAALSTPTRDRNGNKFSSNYAAYHVGLRARMPLGKHYVSAFSGYAMNRFAVSTENKALSAPTPSVDYRMIRSGAGAELALSDAVMLGLDAAWLNFLSVGEIGKWFPRASAGGLEVAASATYGLTQNIYARFAASYQRTFFDFNPRPNDEYAARGATDQYLAMSLGAGIKL